MAGKNNRGKDEYKMCQIKSKRLTIRLCEDDYNYLACKSADTDLPLAYLVREMIKKDKLELEKEVVKDD